MSRRITKAELKRIKDLDALSYFTNYRPEDIERNGRRDWILKEHDSLHFSNGCWCWHSQQNEKGKKIGGKTALDFLIKVEGYEFKEACLYLLELINDYPPVKVVTPKKRRYENLHLTKPFKNNNRAIDYLVNVRGIDMGIVEYCIQKKLLYEEDLSHAAVFLGYDGSIPRYGFRRFTDKNVKTEMFGSNKEFAFNLTNRVSHQLHVFESVIDLLSYITIQKMNGKEYLKENYLSLGGVSASFSDKSEADFPLALRSFLERNTQIESIILHLDSDETGRNASNKIMECAKNQYKIREDDLLGFKDVNELLCYKRKEM